jgi:putative transposase
MPSQILRNSAVNWYNTMQHYLKGMNGCARVKKKINGQGAVHLTNELFKFICHENGKVSLMLGTAKYKVGKLKFTAYRKFTEPKSIHIKRQAGQWWVSFCYDDNLNLEELISTKDFLNSVKDFSEEQLDKCIVSVDRGVKVAAQTPDIAYDLSKKAKHGIKKA